MLLQASYRWTNQKIKGDDAYGGYIPCLMVAGTILNRTRCGWGSILEVISRIPKFAAEDEPPIIYPSIWEPSFIRLLHELPSQQDGSGTDYSKGALYWCDSRRITKDWFRTNILEQKDIHPCVANMNTLMLFK
jgi:hypothetical protein